MVKSKHWFEGEHGDDGDPDTDVGDEGDTGEVGEGEIRGSFEEDS